MTQRQASPHTISGYRDTMRLLLCFAQEQTGKPPSRLEVSDLDVRLISAFLDHLERERHNTAGTRNLRLAAIRSLFRFAALRHPKHAEVIQRVLALPAKRFDRALISFLTTPEVHALLAAPDRQTWTGRRDHALLLTAIQTGLRVSELTGLRCQDLHLGTISYLFTKGKNRKQRTVPLASQTVKVLTAWLTERQGGREDPLFPSSRGSQLSRDAVEWLIRKHHGRRRSLPDAPRQAIHRPRPAAHDSDDAAAVRDQHLGDRALARPRARKHHPRIPTRRSATQTTSARPHHTARHQARAITSHRCAAPLPRQPLNRAGVMPSRSPPQIALSSRKHSSQSAIRYYPRRGITRPTPNSALGVPDQGRAAALVKIGLGQRERLLDSAARRARARRSGR